MTKRHEIELKYEQRAATAGGQMTQTGAGRNMGVTAVTPTGKLPVLKVGDTLVFKSNENYKLNIELLPKSMFWPTNLFSTDETFCEKRKIHPDFAITVVDVGPYRCCCGFVDKDGKSYGYPVSDHLGISPDT